jgi:hypothetical protein
MGVSFLHLVEMHRSVEKGIHTLTWHSVGMHPRLSWWHTYGMLAGAGDPFSTERYSPTDCKTMRL